jgi:hypothetical protein
MYKIIIKETYQDKLTFTCEKTEKYYEIMRSIPGYAYNSYIRKWEFPKSSKEFVMAELAKHTSLNVVDADISEQKEKVAIEEFGDVAKVSFKFDPNIVEVVKGIDGRRYEANEKKWIIPKHKIEDLMSELKRQKLTE